MDWFNVGKLALGAFGALQIGKAAKLQAEASQTDLQKLRDDAQAAGFNPLTVLRATGGQGFNKGSSGALASATFWGNFANAGVSALNDFDPYNQKRKQLDMQQAQASLDNTIASTQLIKSQRAGMLASNTTATIPDSFALPLGADVAPVAPTIKVSKTADGQFVDDEVVSVIGNFTDPDTGQVFQQIKGEDLSEIGANASRLGAMKIQALQVPELSFNRNSKQRGNGQVTQNYRINKDDRFLGALPPLSRTFFIAQGKAMQIR